MENDSTASKLESLLNVVNGFCKDNNIEYVAEFKLGENEYYYSRSSEDAKLTLSTAIAHYQRNIASL